MSGPVGVGVIGAGHISGEYLRHLTTFPDLRVVAIGDIDAARARAAAGAHGVAAAGGPEVVLASSDVEVVVNLTLPRVHAEVSSAAIAAGKHVWSEKPIGIDRAEARRLLDLAAAAGARLGVAPDTVLGPGIQTAKRALARGDIGEPLFAQTALQWEGPEIFHREPGFLYARGGGPLLDMGPYYVSALLHLLGPIASVAAAGLRSTPTRRILVGDLAGRDFPVEVATTVSALLTFERGGHAQSLFSTDSALARHGVLEVTGTEGTLVLPDPNAFGGATRLIRRTRGGEPDVVELPAEGVVTGRGLGVLDLGRALRAGRPHVATGEIGYHVLDTLLAVEESVAAGAFVAVESTVGEIGAIPADLDPAAVTV